jgi:predicted nucleotidyltransferase
MTSIPLSDSLQIQSQLHTLFRQRDEIPLFYVESGSRLWDFASPDSDFDVRGFHLQSREKYFDFGKHRDIIEVMDGNFDLVSYDIDKMFGLLAKSNPTVFEWVRAHICYMNVLPDWEQLQQDIASNYDFGALHYHYISMAKGQLNDMQNGNRFTYKKVFLLHTWVAIF